MGKYKWPLLVTGVGYFFGAKLNQVLAPQQTNPPNYVMLGGLAWLGWELVSR